LSLEWKGEGTTIKKTEAVMTLLKELSQQLFYRDKVYTKGFQSQDQFNSQQKQNPATSMDHNDWFSLSATSSDVNITTAQQIEINLKEKVLPIYCTPSVNSPPIGRGHFNHGLPIRGF